MATTNTHENTSLIDIFEVPSDVQTSPPGDKTGPPGGKTSPPGDQVYPQGNERESGILQELKLYLGKICEHLPLSDSERRRPTGKRSRHKSCSENSSSSEEDDPDQEPSAKRAYLQTETEKDAISVAASDEDIRKLLQDPLGQTSDSVANTENEDELLKQFEADLKDDDESGPSINQQLANIANKRWGVKLGQDKITAILAKFIRPENCSFINVTRVNAEIWSSINAAQRKGDLRFANLQQTLQKAVFATLSTANKLLPLKTTSTTNSADINDMLGNCIDTVAFLGHAAAELSQIRRERLKPSLKAEYHSLCTAEVSPELKLLFGDDLAKQIRDKNETNRIGHAVASTSSKRDSRVQRQTHSWQNKQEHYRSSPRSWRQPPFRKGYRAPKRKKQTNLTPTERGKK